ncbi:hypothetical protein ACHAXA_004322 [Cyclostephanos tholiformis]|uniref:Homeobox domain-containing protein n=1 Tax=Cyclostephanos tholiformis TaxID=382380 RepID=A0ABD3SPV3_9STRA
MQTVHYVSRAVLEEEYGISGSSSDRDSTTLLRRYEEEEDFASLCSPSNGSTKTLDATWSSGNSDDDGDGPSWMMSLNHVAHPYSTKQEKALIMANTGIGLRRINNWFNNNRRRIRKPFIEAGMTVAAISSLGSKRKNITMPCVPSSGETLTTRKACQVVAHGEDDECMPDFDHHIPMALQSIQGLVENEVASIDGAHHDSFSGLELHFNRTKPNPSIHLNRPIAP